MANQFNKTSAYSCLFNVTQKKGKNGKPLLSEKKMQEILRQADKRVQRKNIKPSDSNYDDELLFETKNIQHDIIRKKAYEKEKASLNFSKLTEHRKNLDFIIATYKDNPKTMRKRVGSYIRGILTQDIRGFENRQLSIENLTSIYEQQWSKEFLTEMYEIRNRVLEWNNKRKEEFNNNLQKEFDGIDSGDKFAKDFAIKWKKVIEDIRLTNNKFGASIEKLDDFIINQSHNPDKIKNAGVEKWSEDIKERLDIDRTFPGRTEQQIDEALSEIYENMIKVDNLEDTIVLNPSKLFSEHRFFKFKNFQEQMAYEAKFGNNEEGLFDRLNKYITANARNVALMRTLGPSYKNNFEKMNKYVYEKAGYRSTWNENIYKVVSGEANQIQDSTIFNWSNTIRNTQIWKLGSGALSAIADYANIINGLNSYYGVSYRKAFFTANKAFLDTITKRNDGDFKFVGEHLGLIDYFKNMHFGVTDRLETIDEVSKFGSKSSQIASDTTNRIANKVIHLSMLDRMTQVSKRAFVMEASNLVARESGKKFEDLSPQLRTTFQSRGITENDWNIMRNKKNIKEHNGKEFFVLDNLPEELNFKYQNMIKTDMNSIVIEPRADIRAMKLFGNRGSISREATELGFLFKSFPIAQMMYNIGRHVNYKQFHKEGADFPYLATKIFTHFMLMTGLGYLSMQSKELVKGKTPKQFSEDNYLKVLSASFLQAGGVGILGDFLFGKTSRYDNSFASTLVGPAGGLIEDLASLTAGNVKDLLEGSNRNINIDEFVFKHLNPAQYLFFTKMANQMIADEVYSLTDPQYKRKLREKERRMLEEAGQEFYYRDIID